jgi:hypothetical protein
LRRKMLSERGLFDSGCLMHLPWPK